MVLYVKFSLRICQLGGTTVKKLIVFMVMLCFVLFIQASLSGSAEAARVAIAPIQINESKVERASDFSNYYWDIMVEKFQYPEYELVDDEKVGDMIPDEGLKSFDQAALAAICDKTDADLVVAMRLDDVHDKVDRSNREPKTKCSMKGEFAGYNRMTGRYYYKKMNYSGKIETALTYRNDWQQDAFVSNLRRYIHRMLQDKAK